MKIKIKPLAYFRKIFFTKRQKFALGVLIMSISLFILEHFLRESAIFFVILLSFFADLFLYIGLNNDLKGNFYPQILILPFFYTLAFGLFFPLIPARLITELSLTLAFAIGLYSIFLSQNIFIVSSIRTIALLSSARTVTFVISLLTFLFLTIVVFSLHINVIFVLALILLYSFPLILQSIWTYTLDKSLRSNLVYIFLLTICVAEVSALLWFWPDKSSLQILSSLYPPPILISAFLTGFFYIIVGLSHLWFEKRFFRSTLWGYLWVAVLVFVILVAFTSWT